MTVFMLRIEMATRFMRWIARPGQARWSFIADGRIDSPPTYHNGMILVGSRGGWVYCLRASDGQLAWKFNGMPERRLICDTGRLESAWPVHGSIMIA